MNFFLIAITNLWPDEGASKRTKESKSSGIQEQETLNDNEFKERNGLFKELNETKDSLNISSLVTQASVLLSMLNRKFVEKQLDNCLEEVIECASRIGKDNWVDSAHALCIIGESAKVNMKALNVLLLISNLSLASFHQDLNRTISNSSKTETQENGGGSGDGGGIAARAQRMARVRFIVKWGQWT